MRVAFYRQGSEEDDLILDAIIAGVPVFVLGPGIAKLVSGADLARPEDPYFSKEGMFGLILKKP